MAKFSLGQEMKNENQSEKEKEKEKEKEEESTLGRGGEGARINKWW